mgnify:FL=1
MKLLIASNNQHKIDEIKQIFGNKFEQILSLSEAGIVCDPEENGKTFLDNALIKVRAVAKLTDMPVLGDDTGLCVDALNGAPGVHSARFAGDHDNAKNRAKLLYELQDETNRKAHFSTAVALLYPDGRLVTAKGRVDGEILHTEVGANGFGYDSLFYCNEIGKTFAEATAEEKNAVSHRGRALQNLANKLEMM